MSLIERAELFARAAHGATGQKRKYTGEPYIAHPESVARIVSEVGGTDEMVAAAWLHDVVEDTNLTIDDISLEFGGLVAEYVYDLTDISIGSSKNRAERKALDRAHISLACQESKTIKLADLIHNTESITRHDAKFAKTYLAEKRLLLDVLTEGSKELHRIATQQCL